MYQPPFEVDIEWGKAPYEAYNELGIQIRKKNDKMTHVFTAHKSNMEEYMKRYPDAKFYLDNMSFEDFMILISKNITKDWYQEELGEQESKCLSGDMFCFIGFYGTERECALWLARNDEKEYIHVTNIVPKKKNPLSECEYNELINSFINPQVISELKSANVRVEIQPFEYLIEDVVNSDTVKLLKTFSSCANKSTGTAHPSDAKRWFEFILSSFREGEIEDNTLRDFLIEDGWTEAMASELIIKYEYSIDLLHYYEQASGK